MTDKVIWFGELTTSRNLLRRGLAHLSPGIAWTLVFLAIPMLALIPVGFASRGSYGQIVWEFTWNNFYRLLGYGTFGWSPDYLIILGRSCMVAAVTTIICVLLSYPLCFFIACKPAHKRYFWLTLVIIPFWTNLVIRTYAWLLVLAPQMPLARLASFLGFIAPDAPLYPTPLAVYLGMVSTFLPFVTMPLYASVEKLDWSLVEAARDLYSGSWRVFRHAILPQTTPGLAVGVTLTFIPAMGMFLVPDFLGGAKYMLVGNLIQQQFGTSRDWPFGAAVSLGLMLLTFVGIWVLRKTGGKEAVH